MKILCDVCERDEASVFCVADEASLCAACDHRVHHANKLAGKHQCFSLLHPKQAPLCDICQDRTAFLFCQQDRAILCKDCDIPIHKANHHTQKHARFLLTGVKLSAASTLYSESAESDGAVSKNGPGNAVSQSTPSPAKSTTPESTPATSSEKGIPTSSISEYFMETLPGWHVEDLLDSSSPAFCQSGEKELLAFWDGDFEKKTSFFPAEKMGLWVPQVPPPHPPMQKEISFALPNGFRDQQSTRKRSEDNSFAVPQISTAAKRSRTFWEFG